MPPTEFEIPANDYLRTNIRAFYHTRYTRMGNIGNPNYLNDLKNDDRNCSWDLLNSSMQKLEAVLQKDLPDIHQLLGFDSITACVVPRAKSESYYHPSQMLFRATVQKVVQQLSGFVDGTMYIIRCTNTKTTHLRRYRMENDGSMPYPGITKATCTISPNVKGSNILLIDDIYTPGVNIDEDAIDTLIELGANTVTFYAVGRVIRG